MRKVRAIVESAVEPQDHEVIWYYKGKLLRYDNGGWQPFHTLDASEIAYKYKDRVEVKQLSCYFAKTIHRIKDGRHIHQQCGKYTP